MKAINIIDDSLWKILSRASVVNFSSLIDNSNKAITKYIGKTGLTKNHMKSFMGKDKKTEDGIVLLNWEEEKIWEEISK